ncbi:MAG: U32 family peptidase [Clostridia bacterium]|nr:U32 family peptidase [Clostridia bacterium]
MISLPEILAPAGSKESVGAAVRSGADAVYLGAGRFNARRNAENFTLDELPQIVRYCHEHAVKVHFTLNTLVSDDELDEALSAAKQAALSGVDAFIVQDMGLASAIKKALPDAVLHASTQTSVQTEDGVNFLKENGFSRGVLPRELSEKESLNILEKCDTELEMFVHGALCMCVSGQCLMSSMIGQRSGNRGLCAQPCRLPFSADSSLRYDLSLKDNSLIDYIPKMAKAGIASFKIEGRMKRPEYVAGAVKACRNSLDGYDDGILRKNLKDIFSRSGFTDGYFTGKIGRDMFGVRQKSDSENIHSSIKELKKLYEKEIHKFPISFHVTLKIGELPSVKAISCGFETEVFGDRAAEPGQNRQLDTQDVKKQFQKLGSTQFYLESFSCEIEDEVFVCASELNALRRKAVDSIIEMIIRKPKVKFVNEPLEKPKKHIAANRKTYFVFRNAEQIPDSLSDEELFLPIFSKDEDFKKFKNSGAVMPAGEMHNSDKIRDRLAELEKIGVKKVICPTVDALAIASKFSFKIIMGFNANIYNTQSLNFFEDNGADECVVSVELTKSKINSLGGEIPRGVIAYGKIPLMLTRNCPIKNVRSCGECKGESYLTDRKGEKFEVVCTNGFSEILNPYAIYLFDKEDDFYSADFFVLYFTTESKKEVEKTVRDYDMKAAADGKKFTRGLYYRKTE